jgi:hypothetical protein
MSAATIAFEDEQHHQVGYISVRPIIVTQTKSSKQSESLWNRYWWLLPLFLTLLSIYIAILLKNGPYQSFWCHTLGIRCKQLYVDTSSFYNPEYKDLYDIFINNLKKGYDSSAQLSVWKEGERVLELAGSIDNKDFKIDSLINILTLGQILTNIAMAYAIDQKWINNYDDQVIQYWPKFPSRAIKLNDTRLNEIENMIKTNYNNYYLYYTK